MRNGRAIDLDDEALSETVALGVILGSQCAARRHPDGYIQVYIRQPAPPGTMTGRDLSPAYIEAIRRKYCMPECRSVLIASGQHPDDYT